MDKIFFIVTFAFLSFFAYDRNNIWKNEYTLWKDAVFKSPRRLTPHINLGNAFIRRDDLNKAENEFNLALLINEFDVKAHSGLGVVYFQKGLLDKAIKEFKFTITKQELPAGHNNLGAIYMEKGLIDEAIAEFNTAVKSDPYLIDTYVNLGKAYNKKGMLKESKTEFEKALKLNPEHIDARRNLKEIIGQID